MYVSTCTLCLVGAFESFLCGLWQGTLKLHRADSTGVTSGIRTLVFDTPLVLFACRITFTTDEVESSVKTIFLKIGWIDLISSDFTPYLTAILLLPLRALSPLSYLCSRV